MKAVSIIAEYNPFHNGHKYLIEEAKKQTNAEVVIVIMSGNFLQRGEPAMIDKWSRAESAVKNGADLVIELPPAYSVQSADYFAIGGVKFAQALGSDFLAFGTDVKRTVDYEAFGQYILENERAINQLFQENAKEKSYAQKMSESLHQLLPDFPLDFSSPNHILAMSYAKANARYEMPMKLTAIKRIQTDYHSQEIKGTIASATAIRKAVLERKTFEATVPSQVYQQLQSNPLITWENYWELLKYKLLSSSIEELQGIYQMSEGLEYRLKEKVGTAESFQMFLKEIQTKRYTQVRLQRLLSYCLWNVSQEEIEDSWLNSSIHLLAMTKNGRAYLKQKKEQMNLPIVSKIGRDERTTKLMRKTDKIYQLGNIGMKEQVYGKYPIFM